MNPGKTYKSFILTLVLISGFNLTTFSQSGVPSEYQIKAVFIFNFAQFIDWPENTFSSTEAPFVIGLLGKDPFVDYLDKTIKNEKVNGHPMVVKRFKNIEEVKACHILFINPKKTELLKAFFEHLKNKNTLTVGDAPDFARQGGMIGFYTEDNKIRIQINLEVTKATELTVSSKLLRLASIVSTENN